MIWGSIQSCKYPRKTVPSEMLRNLCTLIHQTDRLGLMIFLLYSLPYLQKHSQQSISFPVIRLLSQELGPAHLHLILQAKVIRKNKSLETLQNTLKNKQKNILQTSNHHFRTQVSDCLCNTSMKKQNGGGKVSFCKKWIVWLVQQPQNSTYCLSKQFFSLLGSFT